MAPRSIGIVTSAVIVVTIASVAAPQLVAAAPVSHQMQEDLATLSRSYGSTGAFSEISETPSGAVAAITHARSVGSQGSPNGAVAVSVEFEHNRWVVLASVGYFTGQGEGAVADIPPQLVRLTGSTDFLVAVAFADANFYGVFSDVGGRWHMVPFPSGDLVETATVSNGVVRSEVGSCVPSCIAGKATFFSYVYDPATGSFVEGSKRTTKISRIASSLPTPGQTFRDVSSVAVNGGIAAAVAMLLTFPSSLFNETFLDNYADLAKWRKKWARRLFPFKKETDSQNSDEASRAAVPIGSAGKDRVIFVAVLLVGALVNSFNDGGFGLSLNLLFTFVAVTLALFAGIWVTATVTGFYHSRRHGPSKRRLVAFPMGLAIAGFFVVFSRLIDFEPGYLYGIVCGVLFTRELATDEEGHVAALSILATMSISVVAWLAWVPVDSVASKPGAFFGAVIADDFLAALFVSGLVGSFFGMIPIRGLPGFTIKRWSWLAWAAGFFLALFGLFQILLRPGIAGHGHRPLVLSVALFAAFGVASVGFHEHFENKKRREQGAPGPTLGERMKLIVRDSRTT